MAVIS
ncbi:hypothetical protein AYI68_g6985, partial [Smittium mucronatum]